LIRRAAAADFQGCVQGLRSGRSLLSLRFSGMP
jgi:hypothetical protein